MSLSCSWTSTLLPPLKGFIHLSRGPRVKNGVSEMVSPVLHSLCLTLQTSQPSRQRAHGPWKCCQSKHKPALNPALFLSYPCWGLKLPAATTEENRRTLLLFFLARLWGSLTSQTHRVSGETCLHQLQDSDAVSRLPSAPLAQ